MIRLSQNEKNSLIRTLIIKRSNAILNSEEYINLSASFTRGGLNKIDEYIEQVASFEAEYILKKYPKEKDITDKHIHESLKLMTEILASLDEKENDE